MTAKFSASADGTKVNIGNAAEDALQIDSTAKTIKALAPYLLKGDIAAQSLAQKGYVKLASGLIIQWGIQSFAAGVANVTFPIAFPTMGIAQGTCRDVDGYVYIASTDNIACSFVGKDSIGNLVGGGACHWFAIGF